MSLPTKDEIHAKATKIFMEQQIKKGLPLITPTERELKETSLWNQARDQLMRDVARAEEREYLERQARELDLRVLPERIAEKAEIADITEAELRQEKKRRKKLEKDFERLERSEADLRRKLEQVPVLGPGVPEAVPLPIKEPPRKGEMVISRDCFPLFRRMWDNIKKEQAMSQATRTLATRTGLGVELINRSLMQVRSRNTIRTEALVNRLLVCECLGPEEAGVTPR